MDTIPHSDTIKTNIALQLSRLKPGASNAVSVSSGEKTHTVAKGETLSSIARTYNVTVDQLCAWNNIKKTDVLKIGRKLVVKK